jgi:ATP-binding cassette subfamily C protein LapB
MTPKPNIPLLYSLIELLWKQEISMRRNPFKWEVPELENESDSLLVCLLLLTKYYKSPCSKRTLTANLPLIDNKLTPALFLRAAERAQFESQIHQSKLSNIKKATLPVVLLLKNGEACLLLDRNQEYARVLFIETGSGVSSIKIDELEEQYSDVAIFVKPDYQFSMRSQDTFKPESRNWFWKVLFKAWPIYAEVLLASALVNLFALAIPLFVMNVYDRVIPNNAIETLWVLASGVVIVFSFDFLLRSIRGYFIDSAGKKVDVELSSRIFCQILGIQMKDRPHSVGALANTVQSFEVFRDFITSTTITILVDLPFVFLYIFIVSLLGGNLYLIPLLMLPVVIIVGFILQWPLIRLTKRSYQYSAEKQATLIESLSGVESIKSYGAESYLQTRWEQVVTQASKLGTKLRLVTNLSVNFTLVCQQLVSISVVIFGVYKISEGELTMGALIACTILSGRAIAPMAQVASLITRYYQSVNSLKSINQVMQMKTDIDSKHKYLHRPNLEGSVEFKDVSFYYETEQVKALNQINFRIRPGERIGIIGTIGAGKSTIAKMIMGLYAPQDGSILIGDVAQDQINPADLRYQIGYVPQDIVLFYGTVKENISFGAAHMDDKSILRAAHIAGVDTFIKRRPEGYDLQVGERGRNLSQGQRQSIALARALLMSPKLLVLDEPCASMDVITERRICQNIHNLVTKDKTLIITTHKLAMLALVNRVLVMDNGHIVLDGSKEEVLQKLKILREKEKSEKPHE